MILDPNVPTANGDNGDAPSEGDTPEGDTPTAEGEEKAAE